MTSTMTAPPASTHETPQKSKDCSGSARQKRLEQALRQNLHRRKQQNRSQESVSTQHSQKESNSPA